MMGFLFIEIVKYALNKYVYVWQGSRCSKTNVYPYVPTTYIHIVEWNKRFDYRVQNLVLRVSKKKKLFFGNNIYIYVGTWSRNLHKSVWILTTSVFTQQ